MIYASVCSGVEAASLAWMPLGWKAAWFSEIEPFPCAVLKHRFPEVPNLGDMTKIKVETIENETGKLQRFKNESGADVVVPGGVDLLVGGTPCQGFSVAGKRDGLNDPRSALCLAYCELLETMRPRWFVWENVPGVFSANRGDDFRAFLRKIDEIGYSCAWRVLDAQYVRVDGFPRAIPQRRRRVFVVGHFGSDFRCPAGVLFEPESVFRNTPPRRTKRKRFAERAGRSIAGTGEDSELLNVLGCDGYNGAITGRVSATVDTRRKNVNGPTLVMASGQSNAEISSGCPSAITCNHEAPIALMANSDGEQAVCYENHAKDSRVKRVDCAPVISANAGTGGNNLPLVYATSVRILLPVECERLMGFPDNWTRIPWRGKPEEECPDSHRYKACGNSMCVNVMRWIGMRIELTERKLK